MTRWLHNQCRTKQVTAWCDTIERSIAWIQSPHSRSIFLYIEIPRRWFPDNSMLACSVTWTIIIFLKWGSAKVLKMEQSDPERDRGVLGDLLWRDFWSNICNIYLYVLFYKSNVSINFLILRSRHVFETWDLLNNVTQAFALLCKWNTQYEKHEDNSALRAALWLFFGSL